MAERQIKPYWFIPKRIRPIVVPAAAVAGLALAACGFGGQSDDVKPEGPIPASPSGNFQPPQNEAPGIPAKPEQKVLTVGRKAPEFSVTTLDNRTVGLDDYQGQPLVILYWGSSFGASDTDLEILTDVLSQKGDGEISLLIIALNKGGAQQIAERGLEAAIDSSDQGDSLGRLFHSQGYPEVFYIDGLGNYQGRRRGLVTRETFENDIKALLTSKSLPTPEKEEAINIPPAPSELTMVELTAVVEACMNICKTISGEDAAFVKGKVMHAYNLWQEDQSLESLIGKFIADLNAAGKTLNRVYCNGGDANILTALADIADRAVREARYFIATGELDKSVWEEVHKSFNLTCEIRHDISN